MDLSAGTRLGTCEILAFIGAGGMGTVYRALDTKLGRQVAVKVLPEEFSQDQDRVARFEREARLLASLNHPHIATLHGLEEFNGQKFLVMELVEGETLAERIERGVIPLAEVLPLFGQIAEGLGAAHEKGVVHRDLKPPNIKITPEDNVKILDFGLAKAFRGEASAKTATGVILGTAPYMSPEQAKGKTADRRTDIWAFGCCLYEALTGKAAFLGDTMTATLAKILERDPDWEALPRETPPSVTRLLRRCLQKDRELRLRDIGDARLDLEEGDETPPAASSRPDRKMTLLVAIALLTALALGVAIGSLWRSDTRGPLRVTRTLIPLAIAPDGRHIAYNATRDRTTTLYLRPLDRLDATAFPGVGNGPADLFFSNDGQWLGFREGGEIRRVPVSGGAPVSITTGGQRGASWGENGIVFSSSVNAGLSWVSAGGGDVAVLTTIDPARREKGHRFPQILPGGEAVLFTLGSADIPSWDDASIAVLSLATGEYRVVLEGGTHARYSPSGHLVYTRTDTLFAAPFDLDALEVMGPPVPVLRGVTTFPQTGVACFALTRYGSLLYAPGGTWGDHSRVVLVDREGRSEPLIETPGNYHTPQLSPDGSSLALTLGGANESIWIYDIARATLTRSIYGYDNVRPVWTPEGDRLTFMSSRSGAFNLFRQHADGSGEAERLTTSEGHQATGSWSRDGKTLVFAEQHPETGLDVWSLSMDGGEAPKRLLYEPFDENDPMLSPDGRWLAYVSNESGHNEVYVRSFPGMAGKRQVSTEGGRYPRWSPNGHELFYRDEDKMMVVEIASNGELGASNALFEEPFAYSANGLNYDVAPDGRRFVMIDESEAEPAPTQLVLVQNWATELERLVPTGN